MAGIPSTSQLYNQSTDQQQPSEYWQNEVYCAAAEICLLPGISMKMKKRILEIVHRVCPEWPADPRTLLRRAPTECSRKRVGAGMYLHIGLQKKLKSLLQSDSLITATSLQIQLNIDGLTIYKNSSHQIWPILCRISKPLVTDVFVVGVYGGPTKPSNVNQFLADIVDELTTILNNGVFINNSRCVKCSLAAVICDTPARSTVKMVCGHTSRRGCDKCFAQCRRMSNKMVFPVDKHENRTDLSFRMQEDSYHHVGRSAFERLSIDMVKCFPLDYMHLVCLGVVKKICQLWKDLATERRYGTHPNVIKLINDNITASWSYIPRDFQRKCRPIGEHNHWKATECKQFLLYIGPCILDKLLPKLLYEHFMELAFSIYVLCSQPLHITFLEVIGDQLVHFVNNFAAIYGEQHVVYNVHGLVHLADDVKQHGILDHFSTFPFENFISRLRRLIHGSRHGAISAAARVCEMEAVPTTMSNHPQLQTDNYDHKKQFCTSHGIRISKSQPDCAVIVNGKPGIITDISNNNMLLFRPFKDPKPLFTRPFNSMLINMYICMQVSAEKKYIQLQEIEYKCFSIQRVDGIKIISMPHTFKLGSNG
ncbi:transposase domain-containing isoform 2 [Schistosoma japonicum]|uniref:Transposase domain-containing isoform 2 n=1 Tax=Schistosoma japonicum TaxID=6182 RepID=A0A4Z2DAK8_SCHJA|nr:transposase domain-containing isoform 2 [Schistosoma japonicum]